MKVQIELKRLIEYNEHGVESYDDLPTSFDVDVYWLASLSSMTYYNGSQRLKILAAPTQPIQSGKFWYLYANSDTVYGGFDDNDKDDYDIMIDLETGEVHLNNI